MLLDRRTDSSIIVSIIILKVIRLNTWCRFFAQVFVVGTQLKTIRLKITPASALLLQDIYESKRFTQSSFKKDG